MITTISVLYILNTLFARNSIIAMDWSRHPVLIVIVGDFQLNVKFQREQWGLIQSLPYFGLSTCVNEFNQSILQ